MTEISGVFTIRNALEAGYPFAESILSAYPAVDEFLVNDGGSDDGTLEILKEMGNTYSKIELYEIPDYQSERWEVVDDQLNQLIDEASGEWILESQADEIWHEDDILEFRELMLSLDDYNSIRQPRWYLFNEDSPHQPYHMVRAVRNIDGLTSYSGGDDFHIGERGKPREGTSAHNVPPEYESDIPLYHASSTITGRPEKQAERHATWLATDHNVRQNTYDGYTNIN